MAISSYSVRKPNLYSMNLKSALYLCALVLAIAWSFGYFVLQTDRMIHILLALAGIVFILGLTRRR